MRGEGLQMKKCPQRRSSASGTVSSPCADTADVQRVLSLESLKDSPPQANIRVVSGASMMSCCVVHARLEIILKFDSGSFIESWMINVISGKNEDLFLCDCPYFFFSFFVFEYKFLRFPASVSLYLSIICASAYFHFNKRCILSLLFLCTGILSEFLNPGPLLFYALVHDSNGRDMIKTHLLEQRNDIPVLSYSPWEVTKKLCFFNVFQCLSD